MSAPAAPPSTLVKRRDEFLGILLVAAGLLLLAALVSYHPNDPSLFSSVADPAIRPRNWAGRLGASYADGSLQFFGLASALVPITLLALGVRRFLSRPVTAWGTKGFGLALLLLSSAPLAHVAFARPAFFGGGSAGGFVGDLLGSLLVNALNPPGAAILLLATLLMGLLLATSISLGDAARTAWLKLTAWWRARQLEKDRATEQTRKEKQRRDVVRKHLERARAIVDSPKDADGEDVDLPGAEVVYIPTVKTLRVREKSGEGRFSIQKTLAFPLEAAELHEAAARAAAKREAQNAASGGAASGASPAPAVAASAARKAAAGEPPLEEAALAPAVEERQREVAQAPEPARRETARSEPPRPIAHPAQLIKEVTPQRILPFPSPKESNGWIFPPEKYLRPAPKRDRERDREEFQRTMELITMKCLEFGVDGVVDAYTPGPVVTTYEFKPSPGVKVARIAALENDLALALAAEKVRIERIPGRSAVGIEVPNKNRDLIALRDVIESEKFRKSPSLLTIALGIDVEGEPIVADLARMPTSSSPARPAPARASA